MTPAQQKTLAELRSANPPLPLFEEARGNVVAILVESHFGRHGDFPHNLTLFKAEIAPDGSIVSTRSVRHYEGVDHG